MKLLSYFRNLRKVVFTNIEVIIEPPFPMKFLLIFIFSFWSMLPDLCRYFLRPNFPPTDHEHDSEESGHGHQESPQVVRVKHYLRSNLTSSANVGHRHSGAAEYTERPLVTIGRS